MGQLEEMNTISVPEPIYGSSDKQSLLKKYNIPIQHFDFPYIEGCTDAKELEKILQVLKSGQEGYYPHLITKVEEQLSKIKPNSRYIRKLTRVLSRNEIDSESSENITEDLSNWFNDINKKNIELSQMKTFTKLNLPGVRKFQESKPEKKEIVPKRISSTDYAAWDKYDPDTEILKMDLEEEKLKKESEKMTKETHKKRTVKFNEFATSAEASFEAQRENIIANEYFKTGEYESAIEHYTNSIACFPSATSYANRGATYLRLKMYEESIADFRAALAYQSNNCQYILQLGKCYSGLEKWEEALHCAEVVIKFDPNNKTAQVLAEKAKQFCGEIKDLNKVRFKIQDIETKSTKTPKKSILKKEEKPEIIPIPGSSKMNGPYYKVVHSKDPNVINKQKQIINNYPKRMFMTNVEITSDDDDCDCTETHVKPSNALLNRESIYTSYRNMHKEYALNCEANQENKYSNNDVNIKYSDSARSLKKDLKEMEYEACKIQNNTQELQVRKTTHTDICNMDSDSNNTNNNNSSNKSNISEIVYITKNGQENEYFTTNFNNEEKINLNLNIIELNENDLGGGGEPFTEDNQDHLNTINVNTPFRFIQAWQSVRRDASYSGFASILRNLDIDRITEVIGNKIDATTLSEILNSLYRHFMVAGEVERVYNILLNLCRLDRFGIIILFLSKNDKRLVQNLLDFLKQHGRDLPENIKKAYL